MSAFDCNWDEALRNIAWVLDQDAGARRTFDIVYANTGNAWEALLYAQQHNPNASQSIINCAMKAQQLLLDRGFRLG